jgi:hypothetical protein
MKELTCNTQFACLFRMPSISADVLPVFVAMLTPLGSPIGPLAVLGAAKKNTHVPVNNSR